MNDQKITAEGVRRFVEEIVADATDPNSDLYLILHEIRPRLQELAQFDSQLAVKLGLVVSSTEELVKYAKNRKEM